jgi:hypothetical protein
MLAVCQMAKYQAYYTIWTYISVDFFKKKFGGGVLLFCDFLRKKVEMCFLV